MINYYVDTTEGKDNIFRSGKNLKRAFKSTNYAVGRSMLRNSPIVYIYYGIYGKTIRLKRNIIDYIANYEI